MTAKHFWDSDTYQITMTAEELESLIVTISKLSDFDKDAKIAEDTLTQILINT